MIANRLLALHRKLLPSYSIENPKMLLDNIEHCADNEYDSGRIRGALGEPRNSSTDNQEFGWTAACGT